MAQGRLSFRLQWFCPTFNSRGGGNCTGFATQYMISVTVRQLVYKEVIKAGSQGPSPSVFSCEIDSDDSSQRTD